LWSAKYGTKHLNLQPHKGFVFGLEIYFLSTAVSW
jgi:hypothetical protein